MHPADIKKYLFGTLPDGRNVHAFKLSNSTGMTVTISELGSTITSIQFPANQADSSPIEICLGYNNLEPYISDTESIGVTVGRYANRIANATFSINGKQHQLSANIPPHQIHGGAQGFGKQLFRGLEIENTSSPTVQFFYKSPDGEMGYPGDLDCSVSYTLTDDNQLIIDFDATCTEDCFINLTNHA
ncbi:MAG: hypothetical protein R3261_14165, partial [Alphaproteobacteria bacterium]|nr:hypothetical protein [Alphaproteobacteria bacterium]